MTESTQSLNETKDSSTTDALCLDEIIDRHARSTGTNGTGNREHREE